MTQEGGLGARHFHKRKLAGFGKHRHANVLIRLLDKAIYALSILGPLATIPQVLEVWIHKNTSGVSMISWFLLSLIAVTWIIYGVIHRDRAIVLNNGMWVIMDLSVAFGVLIY